MLIDIHTHVFPDNMAAATVERLRRGIKGIQGEDYPAAVYSDATVAGLKASMEACGVDKSFVMPIATRPKQFETINKFAAEISRGGILSFGSLHPCSENALEELSELKERGFKGIKLHPEFQQFYIHSGQSVQLIKRAHELDMWVMLHTGDDIGLPPPCHCTPEMLAELLEYVPGNKIIAAHLGGWRRWEEVYDKLCGTPIFMDTAFIADFIDKKLCADIINRHGSDKIFFGSDSPWESPSYTLEFLNSLDISEEARENIKYKNAMREF